MNHANDRSGGNAHVTAACDGSAPAEAMSQVCLVNMPYFELERPSLALGLLKAYLNDAGISATVVYANLECAIEFGLDVYQAIQHTPAESLIGEWTFAEAAFRDAAPDGDAFLARIDSALLQTVGWFRLLKQLHPASDPRCVLTAMRKQAQHFVDGVARRILAMSPRIVGCTSTFQQHCASLALLRRLKELSPATLTMIGGANCEGIMGKTTVRAFPWVDVAMSGEVDAFFGGFCRAILDDGLAAAARTVPEGVFCGDDPPGKTDGLAAPRAILHSLDQAAIPDYDDYFGALRRSPIGDRILPALAFESSRGCWWGMKHHCTFCGLNGQGMSFRSKSPRRVVDEIMQLREKYKITWLQAVDNILDPRLLQSAMPELAAYADHPYLFYEVKANLKREHLALLSRAGVKRIQPGIEGLHDQLLSLMDKGNHWFTNVQLLKWSQEAGISVAWNFLVGIPGERDEWYLDVAEWLPAIYHLQPPEAISSIRYDRFSVYHDRPHEYGLSLVPNRNYGMVFPVSHEMLADLAYFFEDARSRATRTPGHAAVSRLIEEWHRVFAGGEGVRLTARDIAGQLVVHDTRALGNEQPLVFTGLEREVLLACDSARTRRGLEETLYAQGHSAGRSRIDHCIERLKEQRLLLDWHGHILSLHVCEPVTPQVPAIAQPGLVNAASWLNQARETSIAAKCVAGPKPPSLTTSPRQ
jgi:ribosomal peptide maturation radical SAM protein 1